MGNKAISNVVRGGRAPSWLPPAARAPHEGKGNRRVEVFNKKGGK